MAVIQIGKKQLHDRIRAAFYGLAVCDALGGPLEFTRRRHDPKTYVRDMEPNSNFFLPAGHFTDDTSMALCLAASLTPSAKSMPQNNSSATLDASDDPVDQAARYVSWLDTGYMSSVPGEAFDVGNQTSQALQYWRRAPELKTLDFVKQKFDLERKAGNGSLMRVLPCALIAKDEDEVMDLSRHSSEVTHPHVMCSDACVLYSLIVFNALRGMGKERLAQYAAEISQAEWLRGGPLGQVKVRLEPYKGLLDWKQKKRDEISSSGFVVDSLEAALWAFFMTDSFEDGAIEVVNLGDDADTVGAIYGGLAGAFYGDVQCIPARWIESMQGLDIVEKAVDELLKVHA